MGKIRVATLGDETTEQEQKEKRARQRVEKKKREKVHIPGMKGGERLVSMTSDEEVERMAKIAEEQEKLEKDFQSPEKEKKKKEKAVKKKERTKNYRKAVMKVDKDKIYKIKEALTLLREITTTKFDSTVEVHINIHEKGLRGTVTLPHGTGKSLRLVIISPTENFKLPKSDSITVGGEELITKIADGWTDFDLLITHPSMMPKLAKVARFLGPKGLMPNPKAGTISPDLEKLAANLMKGQIQFKSETEFPIIHQGIGKMSFTNQELEENYHTFITAVGASKIKSITLKSTMSPGIKVTAG